MESKFRVSLSQLFVLREGGQGRNMATVPGETARMGLILLGETEDGRMEGRHGEKWRPEGVS